MEIKKGKLYYNTALDKIEKATHSYEIEEGLLTDKIAVHCPTEDDWKYVRANYFNNDSGYNKHYNYAVLDGFYQRLDNVWCEEYDYHIITIEEFKKFYPPIENNKMKTKVTILGQSHEDVKPKKKIEFVKYLSSYSEEIVTYSSLAEKPCDIDNIILLKKGYTDSGLDLMYAWNNKDEECALILGHFNDGEV